MLIFFFKMYNREKNNILRTHCIYFVLIIILLDIYVYFCTLIAFLNLEYLYVFKSVQLAIKLLHLGLWSKTITFSCLNQRKVNSFVVNFKIISKVTY
jgi:hypothetical protein